MRLAALSLLLLVAGCATTSPRFDQELATTFAQDDMHKLVTPELELYYPANYAEAAKRVAARAAECVRLLREKDVDRRERDRVILFLTSANFNNAYVGGLSAGEPLHSVNPLSATSELFHFYGLGGANAGDLSCHEMFHVVHYEQTHGFWGVVNTVFGPVLPPQAFLERWFTEGIAQFYEGRLLREVGRPFSPLYRGSFDSFVALRGGHVGPGDLQLNQRELLPHSGAYLTGLYFTQWLVAKYGEQKLWELMDLQARSVFSPFGYTLRFKAVYGLSLGALVDEWEAELVSTLKVRQRPPAQQVIRPELGQLARVAVHPASGTIAVVSAGNEEVPYLRILEAGGAVRAEVRLVSVLPTRAWVYVGPQSMSGLSFTADGRWLYLINDDLIDRGDTLAQIWKIDARSGEVAEVSQRVGRGMSGSVSGDGRTFTFAEFPPTGGSRIIERELETGKESVLAEFPAGVSVGAPAWNPSHTALAFSRLDAPGWNLVLRAADGTTRELTTDGKFNYGARWADDTHLVFARTAGDYLQASRLDVSAPDRIEQLSDAPWGVLDPSPASGKIVFAARDGLGWSLDSVDATVLATSSGRASPAGVAAPDGATSTTAPADSAASGEAMTRGDASSAASSGQSIPPWHDTPPVQVERDEPYSSLDHLFVPQVRVPIANFSGDLTDPSTYNVGVGLSVMGRDRLSRHTWAINGYLGIPRPEEHWLQVGYRNQQLAPWSILVSAQRSGGFRNVYWSANLGASRSVFTVPLYFGVQTEVWQARDEVTGVIGAAEKFFGAYLGFAYSAGDATPYAGSQRALSLAVDVAGYPRFLASDYNLLDLRAELSVALPLPISRRHSFVVSAIGRSLPGSSPGSLQVGGVSSGLAWFFRESSGAGPTGPRNVPNAPLEPLRAFDDFALRAQHAALFNARYRYHFIIDRGFASLLYLFPSFFLRQIDVEAFGSGAVTEATNIKAAGAALTVRTSFGGILPVSLRYQFAWRFDYGLGPLHVVSLTFD